MATGWWVSCCGWCRCRRTGLGPPDRETGVTEGITPSLSELIGLRQLAQGRRVARIGRHGVHGQAMSNLRGRGMEYAESREYALGDDARHIDWRLTARSGKTHTKLFQAERERLTLLVADTAPALYFGTRTRFKSVQAARAGAVAAWRAVRDGDRIAALRGSRLDPPVSPATGTRGALHVLDALVRWYAQSPADDDGLPMALDHARRLLRPGSRLVVLADPASIDAVPDRQWPALALHHEVIVLLLVDPLERQPPAAQLAFRDGQGARVELGLDAAVVRQRWQQAFAGQVEAVSERLRGHGVRTMALSTDAPSESWLALLDRPLAGATA